MASTKEHPRGFAMTKDPKDAPWWAEDIEAVLYPEARDMLEEYAHVPSGEVVEHVKKAREQAWEVAPYASGTFHRRMIHALTPHLLVQHEEHSFKTCPRNELTFAIQSALTWLNPYLTIHPAHDTVLSKVKNGATILDCGCMVAPDLRYLASKGAPTNNMYAFDLEPAFFPIGFNFYNDQDRWHGTFFQADGWADFDTSPLGPLVGRIDIIWAAKFIHLQNRENQVELASRMVKLLKPVPGSMFVGSQNGLPEPREIPITTGAFRPGVSSFFLGNADTLKEIWNEVAEKTGTKWDVEASLLDMRTIGRHRDVGSEYSKTTGYNLRWTATLLESPTK